MAEQAVGSALEKVGGVLGQMLMQEATFLSGVRTDFEWLQSQLRWMASFMKDADAKRRRGDERLKTWVREVREVSEQAEDVVDTFWLQIESRAGSTKQFFRRYACIPSETLHLHFIGKDIFQIKARVQGIRESREVYGSLDLGTISGDESLLPQRQFSPHFDDDTVVVGFEGNKELIVKRLLDPAVKRRSVVSIVGMGGQGKTTLAAKVYNSSEVKSHFRTCAWITVSQDYRVKELLKNITEKVNCRITDDELDNLEKEQEEEQKRKQKQQQPQKQLQQQQEDGSLHPESSGSARMEQDKLRSKLYFFLKDSKYLIVLDDVWSQEVWEQIKAAFPNTMKGSRLLVTTRFKDVATSADSRTPLYELPFLSPKQSWELFIKKAFPSDHQGGVLPRCPKELVQLGRELVKRCSGLPLAVVVLGGLLSVTDPTINAWREVAENMDWGSTKDGEQCLQIVALSYHHLPHRFLKACFTYLGLFPEDYIIRASEITKSWIAEGFIPQRQNRTLEETVKGYLDELVQRCMVQVVERTTTTRRVKSFRIHDLLRDFCIQEAGEDGIFRICSKNSDSSPDHEIIASRRLVLYDYISYRMFQYSNYKARSLLGFSLRSVDLTILRDIARGFKLLRVIHLNCPEPLFNNEGLSNKFSSLIHLRGITLRCDGLSYIPSSIGKLSNLQTIDVRGTNIQKLPTSLYKIETLRHICTREVFSVEPSAGIGRLRSLQTLKFVKAGSWIQRDLAMLTNLRKLAISRVSSATHVAALADTLHRLNRLASLSLHTEQSLSAALPIGHLQHLYKLVLAGPWNRICCLPQNLISLTLTECEVDQDARAELERLPSLVNLNMNDCRIAEPEIVFSDGGFSQLQKLEVVGLRGLKCWRIEKGSVTSLTYLKLGYGREMEMMVPDGLEGVTSLQKLVIGNTDADLRRRISTTGRDRYKIEHVPFVEIDGKTWNRSS